MKKTILSLALVLIVLVTQAQNQFSIGGGIGGANKFPVVQLALSYDLPLAGVRTGYISSMNAIDPTYFYAAVQKSLGITDHTRIAPYVGYVYTLKSNDNKDLNGWNWLAGGELRFLTGEHTVMYLNAGGSNNLFYTTIGVQMILFRSSCD